jgi:predicted nucleic acid-binding protein
VIVVLDANTLASMAVARLGGTLAAILASWRAGLFSVVISQHIDNELTRALGDPYFTARLSAADVAGYLRFVRTTASFTPLTVTVQGIATHPEDDLVLSTAVSAQAGHLVTGDRQLQRLGTYRGVQILSTRDFLSLLRQRSP